MLPNYKNFFKKILTLYDKSVKLNKSEKDMRECWNWQTGMIQVHVYVRT